MNNAKISKKKMLAVKLDELKYKKFYEKYGASYQEAYDEYANLVESCSFFGGGSIGYRMWIPEIHKKYSASHMIVDPKLYSKCQPKQRDKDAFLCKHK